MGAPSSPRAASHAVANSYGRNWEPAQQVRTGASGGWAWHRGLQPRPLAGTNGRWGGRGGLGVGFHPQLQASPGSMEGDVKREASRGMAGGPVAKGRGTRPGGTGQGPVCRKEPEHPEPSSRWPPRALAGPLIQLPQNQGKAEPGTVPAYLTPPPSLPGGGQEGNSWRPLWVCSDTFPPEVGARSKIPKKELSDPLTYPHVGDAKGLTKEFAQAISATPSCPGLEPPCARVPSHHCQGHVTHLPHNTGQDTRLDSVRTVSFQVASASPSWLMSVHLTSC